MCCGRKSPIAPSSSWRGGCSRFLAAVFAVRSGGRAINGGHPSVCPGRDRRNHRSRRGDRAARFDRGRNRDRRQRGDRRGRADRPRLLDWAGRIDHSCHRRRQRDLPSGLPDRPGRFRHLPGANGHTKVPQLGRVIIGDNVEIGAGTTIDRGCSGDTVIGEGTKIDNLVHIAHNVASAVTALSPASAGSPAA